MFEVFEQTRDGYSYFVVGFRTRQAALDFVAKYNRFRTQAMPTYFMHDVDDWRAA